MIDRVELSQRIFDFLDKHAKTAAAYDPETDDPSERFNGPDSSMLYAAAVRIKEGSPYQMPFSTWGSGCYAPVHDAKAKGIHDEIIQELRRLQKDTPSAPKPSK
jgi:hypothetical protein